jgi:hypothetical protein
MWGAVAAIAVQGVSALISGAQAMNMRKKQKQADEEAARLMQDIYSELEKNQYAAVGLPMKAYDIERENLAAAGAQAIEAGRESERTAAAAAGLTMAQYRKALRDIQSEQGDKMLELELLKAQEDARKGDIKMQFKAQEAEGAAAAAADYEQRKMAAIGGAIQGGIGAAGSAISTIPLFKATQGVKGVSNLTDMYGQAVDSGTLSPDLYDASGNPLSPAQAILKRTSFTPDQLKNLGMYDDKGVFLENKFLNYMSTQPIEDIRAIAGQGFTAGTLEQARPLKGAQTSYADPFAISKIQALQGLYNQYSGVSSPSATQLYDNLSWIANPSRN